MPDFATRFRDATLPVALAASVAVHVSTFAVLVGVDGGPGAAARDVTPLPAVLQARLVAVASVASPEPPIPAPPDAVLALAMPAVEMPRVQGSATPPSPAAGRPGERMPFGWKPRVLVNERVPRARFGDALDGEALSGFAAEIDAPPVVPEHIEIAYPPAALAARKEGAVLVWAVITDQGAVDSVHVVEGDPDFAAAVEEALPRTRFLPARNLGANIPHYVTLEIEFRLDAGGGTVTAARPAVPR
jgi:TonB family protein